MSTIGSLDTWYFWAYYAVGLAIMSTAMVVHIHASKMQGIGPRLIAVAGYLGALGAFVGGIQTGAYPLLHVHDGIALIRFLWSAGITVGIVASILYMMSMRSKEQ
jgi:hypothetical protein